MKAHKLSLVPLLVLLGCAGTLSVLGTPTVVSDTVVQLPPEITNPDAVLKAMRDEYPPLLRDAGIRGSVVLRLFLDDSGQVQLTALDQGSGHPALDELALQLAGLIEFTPAQNEGEAVAVVITVPLDLVPPPPGRARRREVRRGEE
jgi:TonB family protein